MSSMNRSCRTRALSAVIATTLLLGSAAQAREKGLVESDVAYTVHNPGVPGEATIHGTLIQPDNPRRRTGSAVLMLHGAISDGRSWMGPIDGVVSTAHRIARHGHSVYVIDRLGYGRSVYEPFPGAGWALTTNSEVETIHEVVAQIRETGCLPHQGRRAPLGVERVVLVGISLGGGLAELYATRYHDVDGVVSMAWSNQPASDAINTIYGRFVIPQLMLGADHAYFFPPSDGFSEETAWMFYAPGTDPDVLITSCTDGFFGTSPSGELTTVTDMAAETSANLSRVTTPVLLVFAEFDNFFPGADYHGLFGTDEDAVTPEIAMWEQQSGACVEKLIVPDMGHAIPLHEKAGHVANAVAEWIDRL